MRQPFVDRPFAPGEILFPGLLLLAAEFFRQRQQAFRGAGIAVEDDVFAGLAQFGIDVVIDDHLPGIDDAHVHPGFDGMIQEHRMHGLAHRLVAAERERQVRDAAGDMGVRQVLADPARRLDEIDAVIVVLLEPGRDREDIGVEDDVFRREVELVDQDVVGALADLGLARERIGLADLVERHHHHGGAMTPRDLGLVDEFLLAFLHRDRIHHRLALNAFQAGLDHVEFRGIDHHRHTGDIRLGGDEVEERHHRRFGIQQALVHVDVDDLGAVLDLVARHLQGGGVVARGDQFTESRRARDVGTLADVDEGDRGREFERLQAGKPQPRFDHGDSARLVRRDRGCNRGDMIGRGAAAAADDVDKATTCEFADQARHIFRALVILAEFVGQSGIRIGAHQRVGDAADIGDMGAQVLGAERAVEADGDRLGVAHRIPERFGQLAGQQPAGFVGDGARDHHGHVDAAGFRDFGDRIERRLGVERIEDRLDQQQVGAAVQEPLDLLAIGRAQIVEGDGAEAGARHIGRDRCGAVGRADRAGDKARLAFLGSDPLGGGARQLGALKIHLVGDAGEVVIGLRDRGRGKRIGGDDVGAGAQIIGVDVLDRVRLRQDQEIVVAPEVAMEILKPFAAKRGFVVLQPLNHGAHGAVEHQDALLGESK